MYQYLVVGAGLAGSTIAERLASQLNASVLVVDKRTHVAGNTYDPLDDNGLRYHRYGPHIFHTNSASVVEYLSAFTTWLPYEHRVLARVNDALVPIPINRTTLNRLYDLHLSSEQAATFLAARAERFDRIDNSEDMILSRVGRELYEMFFRGYTRKQWGIEPRDLDAAFARRIPTRTNDDDRYFGDRFQAMPRGRLRVRWSNGCSAHPNIESRDRLRLRDDGGSRAFSTTSIYTGPIDEYFGYRYGKLPYRSLRFEFETRAVAWAQPVGCINEPSFDVPFTRTTEYKHLTGQQHEKTVLSREYPVSEGDPYYPIPRPANRELYRKYAALAAAQRTVTFVGRLAEYKYFNMDQVVASALTTFEDLARDRSAVA